MLLRRWQFDYAPYVRLQQIPEVKELMESQMYRLARLFELYKEELNKLSSDWIILFKSLHIWLNGGDCVVNKGDDYRNGANFSLSRNPKYKEEMIKAGRDFIAGKSMPIPTIHKEPISRFWKSRSRTRNKRNMGPVTDRTNFVQVVATSAGIRGNTTVDTANSSRSLIPEARRTHSRCPKYRPPKTLQTTRPQWATFTS